MAMVGRYGGDGNDLISGENGGDHLFGSVGGDTIFGDAGNDFLYGGNGDDTITAVSRSIADAGPGNDSVNLSASGDPVDLTPSSGNDTIQTFAENNGNVFFGFGTVTVRDFTHGEDEFGPLDFSPFGSILDDQDAPLDVTLRFTDLDSNGDGKIAACDLGVAFDHHNLQIDIAKIYVAAHPDEPFSEPVTFNLIGVTDLKPSDFAPPF